MASLTSPIQVRTFGASPRIAVAAVLRKLETETPGTSTGYCIAKKRPARARSSTVISKTFAPSRVTSPPVIVYLGCPAIEYASVDFPEPLGPMIACVSPLFIVKSTPRKISRIPPSAFTETCKFLITRAVIYFP